MVQTKRILKWENDIAIAHFLQLPYDSKCLNLHGHNYYVYVEIEADLNSEGMIIDFTRLKQLIPDHKIIISCNWTKYEKDNEKVVVELNGKRLELNPAEVECIQYPNTTVEYLSQYIAEKIMSYLNKKQHWYRIYVFLNEDGRSGAGYEIVNTDRSLKGELTDE